VYTQSGRYTASSVIIETQSVEQEAGSQLVESASLYSVRYTEVSSLSEVEHVDVSVDIADVPDVASPVEVVSPVEVESPVEVLSPVDVVSPVEVVAPEMASQAATAICIVS
jgi:hypothetical protein